MDMSVIYKRVMSRYERDRREAARVLERRRAEVYAAAPDIARIDEQLAAGAARAVRLALAGGDAPRPDIPAMLAKKRELLERHGFGADYLKPVYICADCRDTGFIGGSAKCPCLTQRLIENCCGESNINAQAADENFDTFDIRYYATEPGESGLSPQENITAIYAACMDFTRRFGDDYRNLLFYGDTGLGKTFLCNCLATELLAAGFTVLYLTAPHLFKTIERLRFNSDARGDAGEGVMGFVYDADLLVIDDLGSEFSTVVTNAELFAIINGRHIARKATVISTNLAPGDLQAHYSDRIASRLFGHYSMMRFFGEDIRIMKKLQMAAGSAKPAKSKKG